MKKKIKLIAGLLSVLSVGGLVSCVNATPTYSNSPKHNLKETEVEEEKEYSFSNYTKKTCKELGIPTGFKIDKPSTYKGKDSFKSNVFTYTRTTNESTGAVTVTSDYEYNELKDAETIIYQPMNLDSEGEIDGDKSKSVLFDGNIAANCKTLITTTLPLNFDKMKTLETLILLDEGVKFLSVPTTLKNIVFVGDKNIGNIKYSDSSSFNKEILSQVEFSCTKDNIYYYAPLLASAGYDSNNPDWKPVNINLVDNPTDYSVDGIYHYGGLVYGRFNATKYIPLASEVYAKSAILSLCDEQKEKRITLGNPYLTEYSPIIVDTVYSNSAETKTIYSYLKGKDLYFTSINSFNAKYANGFNNVYLPDEERSFYVSALTKDEINESLKIYYPKDNERYSDMVEKDFLEGHLVPRDNNECTYTPKLVVEYKGVKKETSDIEENSYETLLEEAKKEYSKKVEETSKDETHQENANKVIALIKKLDRVTKESKNEILEAKNAYEALTVEEQKLVTNFEDLNKAIKEYNELVKDDKDAELIEEAKTKFSLKDTLDKLVEKIKTNKVYLTVSIILGSIFGLLFLYGIFKLFKKVICFIRGK